MTASLDWGHPGFALVNVVEAFGVDPTGTADAGAQINAALAKLGAATASGQGAVIPRGTYLCTTALSNPTGAALFVADGVIFTGANAASFYGVVQYLGAPLATIATPKIQFLGDSNTNGACIGVYRDTTMRRLRSWRSNFEFIGSVSAAPTSAGGSLPDSNVPLGWYHDGHNGASIASTAAAYAGYVAAPTGVPDAVIVMLGSTDIATGRTLAQMQADWATLYTALVTANPNVVLVVVPPPNIVAGSSVGGNLAAWEALRNSFAAWLSGTWVPATANAFYADVTSAIGIGCYVSDGLHWNPTGASAAGIAMAAYLDRSILGPRQGDPLPRGLLMRSPMGCGNTTVAAADGWSVAAHPGFNPGSGSWSLALDFYPTTVSVAGYDNIIGYGTVGPNTFWKLSLYNGSLVVEFDAIALLIGDSGIGPANVPIGLGAGPQMTLNTWARIVLMADASTGTLGLYLNGKCIGLVTGVAAWAFSQESTYVGLFSGIANGAIGNFGRIQAFAGVPARPGSVQATLAAEADYCLGAALVPGACVASFEMDNASLADDISGNPPLVAVGGASLTAKGSAPLRPWEGVAPQYSGTFA